MTKVLLITNIPTPYRIPLFNEINKQLGESGIGFKVIFGARGYARRKWIIDENDFEFKYQVLPSKNLFKGHEERSSFTYPGLYKIINQEHPDIIIVSGFSIATTKLWLRSFIMKTPYIIWSGAIHRVNESKSLFRRLQRKLLTSKASGFIAYGSKAKLYLINSGAPSKKINIAINTVDTSFYQRNTDKRNICLENEKSVKRLLCIGYLTKRKRIDLLIKSIRHLSKLRNKDFKVIIVGDGPAKNDIQILIKKYNLQDYFHLTGYLHKDDVKKIYHNSYCFLFPSEYDIWELVLIEAMAAGLPCLASIKAGATQDVLKDGINGFKLDFENTVEVAEKINWLLNNPDSADEMGKKALQLIQSQLTLQVSAQGFIRSICQILLVKQAEKEVNDVPV
ncbi:MAG: glycosyltransferase family 4 protein [Calditrichaeota bacterium]|nr:glycosyltransferase family 4 protein [Calditrichota bacterium]